MEDGQTERQESQDQMRIELEIFISELNPGLKRIFTEAKAYGLFVFYVVIGIVMVTVAAQMLWDVLSKY